MSDDWTTSSGTNSVWDQAPAATNANSAEGKAPWVWLILGVVVLFVLIGLSFFLKPSGDAVALGYLFYWLISLASFLVPFAFFVTGDLKQRSTSVFYITNPKTVSTVRGIYLGFGLLVSTFFVYGLADELSRIFNAVN